MGAASTTTSLGSSPLARGLLCRASRLVPRMRIIPARAGFTRRPGRGCSRDGDHPRSRGVYRRPSRCAGVARGSSPLARGLPRLQEGPRAAPGIIPARAGFTRGSASRPGSRRDHPRSRGVYGRRIPATGPQPGSSPLARGLRVQGVHVRLHRRIIPARAGFTICSVRSMMGSLDHPRSRGVYLTLADLAAYIAGSSPLARGLLAADHPRPATPGIIPARAGFTRAHPRGQRPDEDHPRSRGVYGRMNSGDPPAQGSSPLARGLPSRWRGAHRATGIIPARAGFTPGCRPPRSWSPDHPRSRGVYPRAPPRKMRPGGSSPLARGLRSGPGSDRGDGGIIPARAGFTRWASAGPSGGRDHPRSRGVYLDILKNVISKDGSSPLARGLQLIEINLDVARRIIPARAGFTSGGSASPTTSRDHPRSRGVYTWPARSTASTSGSSPLARGLPHDLPALSRRTRIIPARAGFTPT